MTGKERIVLELCSLIYMNENNLPYLAESDLTLPPVVLALPDEPSSLVKPMNSTYWWHQIEK